MILRRPRLALSLVLALVLAGAPAHAQPGSVTIPFDFIENRVVLQLKLDGKGPFAFVLDSGASYMIAPQVVTALGLTPTGSFTIGGTGPNRVQASRVRIASVSLGPITMNDQTFTVTDFDEIRRASGLEALDGLIGSELFRSYVVRIDYRAHLLTLTTPSRFAYHGRGEILPCVLAGGTPRVEASLDGIAGAFTVDTGDRMDVTFMEPVIEREHLLDRYVPRVETITGWGFGGAVPGYIARAHDLRLGSLDVREPLLRLPTVNGGFFTSHRLTGSIGTGVIDRFTVTFDYAHRRLIFEDPDADQPTTYDRSGLWLNQGQGDFEVAAVAPQSPADQAGIAVGDRIIAVNGLPASSLSLAQVREWLRSQPGTRVLLTVEHRGRPTELAVTLRDLV